MDVVLNSSMKNERSLLQDVDIEEEGRVRIDTSSGSNVTSDVVLEALEKRKTRKESTSTANQHRTDEEEDVRKNAEGLRRYAELADRLFDLRKRLRENRGLRLEARRIRARASTNRTSVKFLLN